MRPHVDPRSRAACATAATLVVIAALGLFLAVSGAGAVGAAGIDPSFAAGPQLPLGPTPSAAIVGDFDRDGSPDIAVANAGYYRSDVRILLNDGTGRFRFAPGSPFKAGAVPTSLVKADFNGDGDVDLAVAAENVRVLLGDGTGRFSAAAGSPVQLAEAPQTLLTADLNSDGRPDLVALTWGEDTGYALAILLNDGSAGFTVAQGPDIVGHPDSVSIALADFNGDRQPDLALSRSNSSNLSIFPGNGAGSFGPPIPVPAGKGPGQLEAADFNGDGKHDLCVFVKSGLAILLGDGAGVFRPAPGSPLREAKDGYALAVADLNGDAEPDLAYADPNPGTGAAVVLLGDGAGGFRPAAFSPFYAGWPGTLVAADLNDDGRTDLLPLDNDITWGPAPRGNMVLFQTASTPQVLQGRSLPPKADAVFSTKQPLWSFAADGKRAAFCSSMSSKRPLRIWTVSGRGSTGLAADCDAMSDLAIAGTRVAWIANWFGNTDRSYGVFAANVSGGRVGEVDSSGDDDIETENPDDVSGPWVGGLLGGGSVLAYNYWWVGCVPPPCDEECENEGGGGGCDGANPTLRVSGQWLGRIEARRAATVRNGASAYPLRAVGGGRIAVEPAAGVVVLKPNGSRVSVVPALKDDPPRSIALSRTQLAVLRTFTLDLYDPATGAKHRSIALGPAAGLELAGVNAKLALLRGKGHLVLVRLSDGKLVSFPLAPPASAGFVDAKLTGAGLFYAYNLSGGARRGRIVFEPTAKLLARF